MITSRQTCSPYPAVRHAHMAQQSMFARVHIIAATFGGEGIIGDIDHVSEGSFQSSCIDRYVGQGTHKSGSYLCDSEHGRN